MRAAGIVFGSICKQEPFDKWLWPFPQFPHREIIFVVEDDVKPEINLFYRVCFIKILVKHSTFHLTFSLSLRRSGTVHYSLPCRCHSDIPELQRFS